MPSELTDQLNRLSKAVGDRYRVERELGSGGMALVYLAVDVRHDRKVALKVLRPELAAAIGGERFLQEIRTLAHLQHPHIVSLLDSGESDSVVYYAMPWVEGESLRDRLQRETQLPVADAVRIARDVASALDYAHRHGVIHRDIKPENILLHDGSAVVADFGIALAVQSAGGQRLTQTGLSLGTPQYMAPEQAMGERTIDPRTDVYALGAVLYEMLVGEAPFTGPTVQAILARTMTEAPRAPTVSRKSVPENVDAAVMRALEKLPADRFSSAAEFAQALDDEAPSRPMRARLPTPAASPLRRTLWALGALAIVIAAALSWTRLHGPTSVPLLTARIAPADNAPSEFHDVALSPDGSTLAYVSAGAFDGGRIWLRRMSDGTVQPIAETEGARQLFWAPDGSGIGFFANGSLRVVMLGSGAVRTLAIAALPIGGTWGSDGTIVYSPDFYQLWRVSVNGGEAHRALGKDDDSTPASRSPSFLPDGRHFIYWRNDYRPRRNEMWVGDLATGKAHKVADNVSTPMFVPPNYVLYFETTEGTLEQPAPMFARRFDPDRAAFSGDAVQLSTGVDRPDQSPVVSATRDFLVMREPPASQEVGAHGTMYWIDRATGRRSDALKGTGHTWAFRISHDGRRVALAGQGVWDYDPQRDVSVRLALRDSGGPWPLVWSPDDREIAVAGGPGVRVVRVDGSAPERMLKTSDYAWADPMDWSPEHGGTLYFLKEPIPGHPRYNLWRHVLATQRSEMVTTGAGNAFDAKLSPDWQWIAWESDESGRREIYLGPVTGTASPIRVSKDGGGSPRWRHDGKELFFIGGDGRLMSVSVQMNPAPQPPKLGEPKRVADWVINPDPFGWDPYLDTRFEPTPDGQRFLVQTPLGAGTHQLTLIQGWQARVNAGRTK